MCGGVRTGDDRTTNDVELFRKELVLLASIAQLLNVRRPAPSRPTAVAPGRVSAIVRLERRQWQVVLNALAA